MKILSIETSCDETAVSLVEAEGGLNCPVFEVLGNALFSQIDIHKEYGGVYPMIAKREHAKKLIPLLLKTLEISAPTFNSKDNKNTRWNLVQKEIENILEKEHGLFEEFEKKLKDTEKPNIDVISVTAGPGLEPAL